MTLYVVSAECPDCGAVVEHAEETEAPVGLMQDVPISARFCPQCGFPVFTGCAEWDVREDHRAMRIPPVEDVDGAGDVERALSVYVDMLEGLEGVAPTDVLHGLRTVEDNVRPYGGGR